MSTVDRRFRFRAYIVGTTALYAETLPELQRELSKYSDPFWLIQRRGDFNIWRVVEVSDEVRAEFEDFVQNPPWERSLVVSKAGRYKGEYRETDVRLAWNAWIESLAFSCERLEQRETIRSRVPGAKI